MTEERRGSPQWKMQCRLRVRVLVVLQCEGHACSRVGGGGTLEVLTYLNIHVLPVILSNIRRLLGTHARPFTCSFLRSSFLARTTLERKL